MRILIIGSGAREHALGWKLAQGSQENELFFAPGNPGTACFGTNVAINGDAIDNLMTLIKEKNISLVIPGPELPLVKGIADACKELGVHCFGPNRYAAQLEGSKVFAKELMQACGVPTASYRVFTNYEEAARHIEEQNKPLVIKVDGLAAGKGVILAKTPQEAKDAAYDILHNKSFGSAGNSILVEETLEGEEASFLCICSGKQVIHLPSAQDHKAVFDGDKGANTGGMGAYSPAPILPEDQYQKITELTVLPILQAFEAKGNPFVGILYVGLMMTKEGPKVLEYNVRFGDPECQALLMRLESNLCDTLLHACKGSLDKAELSIRPETAVCVVIAAEGYPGDFPKGLPIHGIDKIADKPELQATVFLAGVEEKGNELVSSGGRILSVVALGKDISDARQKAYAACKFIAIPHSHYRTDIGNKAEAKKS